MLTTPAAAQPPKVKSAFWHCALIGFVLILAIGAVAYLGNAALKVSDEKHADETSALRTDLGGKLDTALAKQAEQAALIQSIGQALNTQVASGSLTQVQLAAIASAVQSNQAVLGGIKAQAGTTPGIPGSRSGGGKSVTPGVVGSAPTRATTVVASPGVSRSSTGGCLLTIESGILRIDGTVCPG